MKRLRGQSRRKGKESSRGLFGAHCKVVAPPAPEVPIAEGKDLERAQRRVGKAREVMANFQYPSILHGLESHA